MQLSRLLSLLFLALAPIALLSTTWLYLYPIFHTCAFPSAHAPFRLLALGDPQLEGDSSLPDPNAPIFPSLEYFLQDLETRRGLDAKIEVLKDGAEGVVRDGLKWLEGRRKAIDLWGNDRYLAHIVRTTRWWSEPTHVAVLGDLLGSQWITDGEFEKRAGRYWDVVMRGLERVPERIYGEVEEEVVESAVVENEEGEDILEGRDELHGEENAYGIEDVEEMANKLEEVDPENETGDVPIQEEADDSEAQVMEDSQRGKQEDGSGQDIEDIQYKTHIASELQEKGDDKGQDAEEKQDETHTASEPQAEEPQAEEPQAEEPQAEEPQAEELQAEELQAEEPQAEELQAEELQAEGPQAEGPQAEEPQVQEPQVQEPQVQEPQVQEPQVQEPQVQEPKPLRKPLWGGTTEILGDDKSWANRVINIAGNHDVGYAGDLDVSRVARFEKAFGSVNWDIWFTLPSEANSTDTPPALRIVILNTMNIDTPAWAYELQTETYSFMNHIITSSRDVSDKTHATVLLTHIPLEKEPGVCVDSPLFNYFDDGQGIREQNMLSEYSSRTILQGMFGLSDYQFGAGQGYGRHGIILNGHDHEGCDVTHFIRQNGVNDACDVDTVRKDDAHWPAVTSTPLPPATSTPAPESYNISPADPLANDPTCPVPVVEEPTPPEPIRTGWRAHRFPHRPYSIQYDPATNTSSCTDINSSPRIREITLRSMMGDFSGHAGFLSAYFDREKGDKGEWVFEFASCGVGVQHWWWAVHSVDLALLVIGVLAGLSRGIEKLRGRGEKQMNGTKDKKYAKTNGW